MFVSHASEDKVDVVHPLVDKLITNGIRPWIDHQQVVMGDSLHDKLGEGLLKSEHGIVILSRSFFAKKWPKRELDALLSFQDRGKRVLPVLHGIDQDYVAQHSPFLNDVVSTSTNLGLDKVVEEIVKAIRAGKANE